MIQQRMRTRVKEKLIQAKIDSGVKNPKVADHEITQALQHEDISEYVEISGRDAR